MRAFAARPAEGRGLLGLRCRTRAIGARLHHLQPGAFQHLARIRARRFRLRRHGSWCRRLRCRRLRLDLLGCLRPRLDRGRGHGRRLGFHDLARFGFRGDEFATRFAFPPCGFVASLRLGAHLRPVHFPLPLAQLLDVGRLRQERGYFASGLFLLERVGRQACKLRTRNRTLFGTPVAMAIPATAPAAALLVAFAARGLDALLDAFHAGRLELWLSFLRDHRRARLALPALLVRPALPARALIALLVRPALPARALIALLVRPALSARALIALLVRPALPARALIALLVRSALPALLRPALAPAVLVARTVATVIAALVPALAALAMFGPALALRLRLATRLARRA
jgi:hypothetical protein